MGNAVNVVDVRKSYFKIYKMLMLFEVCSLLKYGYSKEILVLFKFAYDLKFWLQNWKCYRWICWSCHRFGWSFREQRTVFLRFRPWVGNGSLDCLHIMVCSCSSWWTITAMRPIKHSWYMIWKVELVMAISELIDIY